MTENFYDKIIDLFMGTYIEALQNLEEYGEYILASSDYTVKDIVVVHADLGDNRQCQMLVCPSSCIVNGFGILPCDYFIGIEEVRDKHGTIKGWEVIYDIPDKFKTSLEEIEYKRKGF